MTSIDFKKIYLKKTCYKISNLVVQQGSDLHETPQPLSKSLAELETGQVYEVVYKVKDNFLSHEEMVEHNLNINQNRNVKFKNPISATKYEKNSHILIHIVNNKATLNGKIHTLTFLKDVTFGVLYEQIKSQD